MAFDKAQKNYLKKNIRQLSLEQIGEDLQVSEKQVLAYLKKQWREEKYKKYVKSQKQRSKKDRDFSTGEVLFLLAVLVLVVYFNSLGNEFLSDDITGVLENEGLKHFSYVLSNPLSFMRPLVLWLVHSVAGLTPWAYRLANILFHWGSTCFAFLVIKRLASFRLALITSVLFAVHPILIESITWISGGPYSQYSFFLLFSFYAYLKGAKNKRWYFISLAGFLLAITTSEKAVIWPLILFVYEFSFNRARDCWKRVLPFFILSGVLGMFSLRGLGQRSATLTATYYVQPGFSNPLTQIPIAISSYLGLIFWPKDLTLYHSEMQFSQLDYVFRLVVFCLFMGIIIYVYKRSRFVFFWLLFFVISLLPTLTPFRISWIVAERYVYLGTLGILVVAAMGFKRLIEIERPKYFGYGLLALVVVCLSIRTIVRNVDWKNQDNLWLAAAKTSPSSSNNRNNLGDLYARRGEFEKAIEEFKKAIELKPGYADAYHNMANVYIQIGQAEEAINNYQQAIKYNPRLWQPYRNLAVIYYKQGKKDLALEKIERALEIAPEEELVQETAKIIRGEAAEQ